MIVLLIMYFLFNIKSNDTWVVFVSDCDIIHMCTCIRVYLCLYVCVCVRRV